MKSQFSELSYAYALTECLVEAAGMPLLTAPTFPSTVAEGKADGGYDLKLSLPGFCVFLQFKLSHSMGSKSAKEFTSGKFDQIIGGAKEPVYRMYLHALGKSQQTSLMLGLEKKHGLVYYVAPLFHLPSELNENYLHRSVAKASRFFSPSAIRKMPDLLEHFVSFRAAGSAFRFSNEPLELEAADTQDRVLERMKRSAGGEQSTRAAIEGALSAMLGAIEDIEHEQVDDPAQSQIELAVDQAIDYSRERTTLASFMNSNRSTLSKAEFVARTYFDSQLLTFQRDT